MYQKKQSSSQQKDKKACREPRFLFTFNKSREREREREREKEREGSFDAPTSNQARLSSR